MRVLITGGFGFIGSSLAKRLVELNHDVSVISRSTAKSRNVDGVTVNAMIMDIRDIKPHHVRGYDVIFHCASTVDNYNILSNPLIDTTTNCIGTAALLDACTKSNLDAKVIYTSSFFVNGNLASLPATPESPCNPRGLYGATKLAAEHFCRVYHSVYGIDAIVARLVNIFGPGEQRANNKKAALNRMIDLAVRGEVINLYGHKAQRDILYIDDAVDGLLAVMDGGGSGETYYIGYGKPQTIESFARTVVEEAKSGTIIESDTPRFHIDTGIGDFWCDPAPLISLGWTQKTETSEGIRKTISTYRLANG
jgi:nucleoside-diphosphate-sugar epimerase